MEFASSCWDPAQKNLKISLEKVQNTAARFVSNFYPKKESQRNYSITEIVQKLGWESLEERRKKSKLVMAFKILNGHVILEPDLLPPKTFIQKTRNENRDQLEVPFSKIDNAKKTFFYDVPSLWNSQISAEQANAPSIEAFKRRL